MIFLTFLTAIALSAVAGYYSVVGLASIFPGSDWSVILMGSVLEASKLVTVSWLYRNWHRAGWGLKIYLSSAVTILMLITSMGIFGYLSKAHLEHSSDTAPLQSRVELLQEKIRVERETIEESRKELKQLDGIVDQTVGRTTDEKGVLQAQALRRSQQKDRSRLVSQIEQSQKSIASHQEELAPLSVEFKKAEADLGPIKYVAALAYGDEAGVGAVEKAVRFVIGLIIVVFDPLAILLLIAGNISLANKHKQKNESVAPDPWIADVGEKPTPEEVGFYAEEVANVIPEIVTTDEQTGNVSISSAEMFALMVEAAKELNKNHEEVDKYAYMKQPFKHFENLKPMPAPKPEIYAGNPEDFKPWPEGKKEEMVAAMQDFFNKNKTDKEEEVREIKMEIIPEETVEIPKDNLIVIDEVSGESIPPITKYDYSDPYTFREKDKK
jgi:hypothetical protein